MLTREIGLRTGIISGEISEYDETILAYDIYCEDGQARYECRYEVKLNEKNSVYVFKNEVKVIDDCVRRCCSIMASTDPETLYYRLTHEPYGLAPKGTEVVHTYCEYFQEVDGETKNIQRSYDIADPKRIEVFPSLEVFKSLKCGDKRLDECCVEDCWDYIILADSSLQPYPEELTNWVQYKDSID